MKEVAAKLEMLVSGYKINEDDAVWLRAILARPAEAEGVDRQRIIEAMCLTWRHDFGLDKPEGCPLSSGMTEAERDGLRRQMGQLFDHHFGPALASVTAERDRLRAVLKGAQYPNIDLLKTLTVEQCRQVGEAVTRLTIDAQSERDQLLADVETLVETLRDGALKDLRLRTEAIELRNQAVAEAERLRAEVEASRLLLRECDEIIAEDGVYIELRAYLSGELPASEVIALLGRTAMTAKDSA